MTSVRWCIAIEICVIFCLHSNYPWADLTGVSFLGADLTRVFYLGGGGQFKEADLSIIR